MSWFANQPHILQALLAGVFTWAMTAGGASLCFLFKSFNRKTLDSMLGFAAGVMIAASFWSLLAPAIEMAEFAGKAPWVPAAIGFLSGGLVLYLIDKALPHTHPDFRIAPKGNKTSKHRSILLVLAITIHNIPEGLAVGVAFGALAAGIPEATLAGAIALALGIGIQNFPEGTAVSVPLRREGMSRTKSFWYGQLSGIVEPISAVLGAWLVILFQGILPYALAFAAGAMIYVAVEELIPESQKEKNDIATLSALIGFSIMMILDVALG